MMSATAPWLPLAVDWHESEMWGPLPEHDIPDEATDGERLAWISLLCEAKIKGRGGKVTIRKNAFRTTYRLSDRAVEGMLRRAQKCGAATIDGNSVTLCNWRTYHQKSGGKRGGKKGEVPEVREFAESAPTHHTSHITHHPSPITAEWEAVEEILLAAGVSQAVEAVASCRDAGCNPVQVRNLVEWWRGRQPAWDAGALFWRIMRFRPDQDFMLHWPRVSPKAEKQAAAAKLTAKSHDAAALRRQREADRLAEKAEAARLEQAYGKVLDMMPKAKLKKLIGELYPDVAQCKLAMAGQLPNGAPTGGLRIKLLCEIDRRNGEPP